MTEIFNLFYLEGYMYMISNNTTQQLYPIGTKHIEDSDSIITSHRALASSNSSLNLPLLPEIEEELYTKDQLIDAIMMRSEHDSVGYILSRIKPTAKAKQYTEEDIRTVIRLASAPIHEYNAPEYSTQQILERLKPLPKQVEVEMVENENWHAFNDFGTSDQILYVVNNIVQVKRWIYD